MYSTPNSARRTRDGELLADGEAEALPLHPVAQGGVVDGDALATWRRCGVGAARRHVVEPLGETRGSRPAGGGEEALLEAAW